MKIVFYVLFEITARNGLLVKSRAILQIKKRGIFIYTVLYIYTFIILE